MQFLYIVAALVIVGLLGGRVLLRRSLYPKPPQRGPVTTEGLEELLGRLEAWLRQHAPAIADALRPGLSEAQIAALEAEGGLKLSDDLRRLYRWHDGTAMRPGLELLPGHRFLPLSEAVRERATMSEQFRSLTLMQRVFYGMFGGHRAGWLTVFGDGSGDGYFYDAARRRQRGSFFFNFHEDGWYQFFPTLADFVAAVLECFESGAFRPVDGGADLRWDAEKSIEILGRYSVSNRP